MQIDLEEIQRYNKWYITQLEKFEYSIPAQLRNPYFTLNDYLDLKRSSLYSLKQAIVNFDLRISSIQNNIKPISTGSLDLTNGKFYDFAVNHEMYKDDEPELYELIKTSRIQYIEFENSLNKYIA